MNDRDEKRLENYRQVSEMPDADWIKDRFEKESEFPRPDAYRELRDACDDCDTPKNIIET